jgi:metallo-beta-lactamase family protein
MCEGGRILHHLRNHVEESSTTILFVGYQAQNTLGRRLLEGNREIRVLGVPVEVRARVRRADAYSAHADRTGLLGWAEGVRDRGRVMRYFLVHGEADSAMALAEDLRTAGTAGVEVPERGSRFELE